jgi:CHAD domain-containing protein
VAGAFKAKKSATREARKILLSQIGKALQPLEEARPTDEHIHRARKQIKKARATLRLLRKSLPRSRYRAENDCLRNAAQPLSQARDAAVLLRTLDHLDNGSAGVDGAASLRRQLFEERSRARAVIAGPYGLPRARRLLHNARAQASHWQLNRQGWSVVGPGLKKVYARGRNALAAARRTPSDEKLHEWRKQCKYLRHQLELLEPAWPGPLGCLAQEAHLLSDLLGDDHDLAVLRDKARLNRALRADQARREALLALIDARRHPLQLKALRLGKRLYADSPKRFSERLEHYWHAWRQETGQQNGR